MCLLMNKQSRSLFRKVIFKFSWQRKRLPDHFIYKYNKPKLEINPKFSEYGMEIFLQEEKYFLYPNKMEKLLL